MGAGPGKVVVANSTGRVPDEDLLAGNLVAASGATQTIPDNGPGAVHHITLTANCTITFPTGAIGKHFYLVLKQDGTGSRTVTWPSGAGGAKWAAGAAPTLTTTATTGKDAIEFVHDGTAWLGIVRALAIA